MEEQIEEIHVGILNILLELKADKVLLKYEKHSITPMLEDKCMLNVK